MQGEQRLETLAVRVVDTLSAIASCQDGYKRGELMAVYRHLLLKVPDDQPTLTQETQDILEDVNTEFMEYDPRAKHGLYRDDNRVLHNVVKALWAVGWDLTELRFGGRSGVPDQEAQQAGGPRQVEHLLLRVLTVLVVIAVCGDPYLRRSWSFHLAYLLHEIAGRDGSLTEEAWTVLEGVSKKLAGHEPRPENGSRFRTVARRFSFRRRSGSSSHTPDDSCRGNTIILRHVVRALAAIARGAGA